jgi:hypothetical protein
MRPLANTTGNKFDRELPEREEPQAVTDFTTVI